MKKIRGTRFFILMLFIVTAFSLTGCSEDKSGSTIDEPEITVEYLENEYAAQLDTDGAETITGYVKMEKNDDDSYTVHVEEQAVVPNSDYEDGYYIADKNISKDFTLGDSARMTCNVDGKVEVSSPEDFEDSGDNDDEQLYTVYFMGDYAELILSVEPESLMTE